MVKAPVIMQIKPNIKDSPSQEIDKVHKVALHLCMIFNHQHNSLPDQWPLNVWTSSTSGASFAKVNNR